VVAEWLVGQTSGTPGQGANLPEVDAWRRDPPAARIPFMPPIDDHIAAIASPEIRALVQRLREVIAAAAPDAEESWSYAMPAFRYRGRPLVAFAGTKGWAGFYPMSDEALSRHADELAAFSTSKGTIRFTPATGVPQDLVAAIVQERVAQLQAKPGRR